jgi:RHS repeat-associated protein
VATTVPGNGLSLGDMLGDYAELSVYPSALSAGSIAAHFASGRLSDSSTSIASSLNPSNPGDGVTFTATVTTPAPFSPITGSVTFRDGATAIGSAAVDATGHSAITTSALAAGAHAIVATYSGNTSYVASASLPLTQRVGAKVSTASLLTSSVNPSAVGQPVTITAQVTDGGSATPTGSVTFSDGATALASVQLAAPAGGTATATLTIASLGAGSHSITVAYGGDANFNSSTSPALTQTVSPIAGTTTQLSSSVNPSTFGQAVTFTATVQPTVSVPFAPSGNVLFYDGGTQIATANLNGSAQASFITSALSVGAHTITATYGGGTDFTGSTSGVLTQTVVTLAVTTASLTSNRNPSVGGRPVTYTAAVTSSITTAGVPTGTVTFYDGSAALGTVGLDATARASLTTTLATGTHTMTATYSGDRSFNPSISPPLSQFVNPPTTTSTILASSRNPSIYGQAVSFTATVRPQSTTQAVPSGQVNFLDGATTVGTATLDNTGHTSFNTSALAAGQHSIIAVYLGDYTFDGSTSPPISQLVNPAATATGLSSSATAQRLAQPATFSASVTATAPGAGIPAGTVTFSDGGSVLAAVQLDANGNAELTTSSLSAGVHSIFAAYSGAPNFFASTSAALQETINAPIPVTVVLTSDANPSVFGQAVNFTATVASSPSSSLATPSGTVTYLDGSTTLRSATLNSAGQAALMLSTFTVGSHSITASYGGDTTFLGGTSTALSQVVNQATSTTAVTADMNPAVVNRPVTLTATVSPVGPGAGTPTGTVTFADGPSALGSATLDSTLSAKFTTSSLTVGNHTITATYAGDVNFAGSTSPGFTETLNLATSTFTSLTPSQNPAVVGQSVALTATVSSTVPVAGTPTGTVIFSDGTKAIGTASLDGGAVATLNTATLSAGSHPITAAYSGNSAFGPSTSDVLTERVTATASTTTTLAADLNPALFGQVVALTAAVKSQLAGTPTGTVVFQEGPTVLGSAPLNASASAQLRVSTLAVASHTITAAYSGDARYSTSTSVGLTETIDPAQNLFYVTIPSSITAGATSGLIAVQLEDQSGRPVAAGPLGLTVLLDHSSGLGHIRDDADSADITSVFMPTGASMVSFRYLDTYAGQAIIKASAAPSTGIGSAITTLAISPGPLDHLVLAPGSATATIGAGRTYTADGFDAFGNDVGDKTAAATFTIVPDGSCKANLCTVAAVGLHRVNGAIGTATGNATLIGDVPPVPNLIVFNGAGVAPHDVTFSVTAAYSGIQPLTYTLDFGDGSTTSGSLPAAPISHTYAGACPSCTVILTVSDGIASPAPDAIATVDIAPGIPAQSRPGDPLTVVLGKAAHLDGSNSVPAPPGITSYHWDFGDGTSAEGAVQDHAYPGPAPKDWTATLTVSAAAGSNSAPVVVHVIPSPPGTGLVVGVTGDGSPLAGALVAVEDANNNVFHAIEAGGGNYRIDGLKDGAFTAYAYKLGFVPNVGSAKVLGGAGSATIALVSGQFATSQIKVTRLTAQQAQALGIDTTLPGNQNVFQFEIHLAFVPDHPIVYAGIIVPSVGLILTHTGDSDWRCPECHRVSLGGGAVGYPSLAMVNDNPVLIWMIIPGKAKWLKEFFQVQTAVTNLGPSPITFQNGSSTLNLPSGLSLADLNPGRSPQSLTKSMPDMPGQTTQTTDWLIRGDAEGFYSLSADYHGAMQPLGAPVHLHAQTSSPIHVWGGSALHMTVDADSHAYSNPPYSWPYHVSVSLTNVADVPVYNPVVELTPLPDGDPRRNYLFQPREQFDQGTDRIDPGQTFTTRDYIVAPDFVPASLDVAHSFVLKTGGNAFIPSTIISHQATPPIDVPAFAAATQGGSTQLYWEPILGAIAYQVFSTPDFQHSFPTTFLTQVDGTQLGTTLPATPFGEIGLSTVILGSDGAIHNVMFHNLTQAAGSGLPDPCTAFGWDPYGGTIGNFVYSTTDIRVNTAGPRLELTRSYNSLDTHAGAFGVGWHFSYEMTWERDASGNIAVHYPDGRCEVFQQKPDGSFAPPLGYTSTLKPDGAGGFALAQKDRIAYGLGADGTLRSITDSNGRSLALTYDASGHLARVTDTPSGRYLAFGWTGNSITSVATNPVTGQGALTWKYYYTGNSVTSACDPRNNPSTGFCAKYGYGSARLMTVTKPAGNVEVQVTYRFDGKMDSRSDGSGNVTLYEYPMPTVVRTINPLGNATVTEYDGLYRVVREVDAAGNAKSYVYDAHGVRSKIIDANGTLTSMTYDSAGNLTAKTDGEGHAAFYTYDTFGQTTIARDARSSSAMDNTYATTYTYDNAGNRLSETRPATPDLPTGTTRRWAYSTGSEIGVDGHKLPAGLLLTDADAAGNQTTYSYDSKGDLRQVVDRAGLKTTYTYDEIGRRLSSTVHDTDLPGTGAAMAFAYDKVSDPVSVVEPAALNGITGASHQRRTVNTFDANRNLVRASVEDVTGTDPARVTSYAYDPNDRQIKVTDPLGGVTTRHYNSVGKVDQEVDAAGRISTINYDVRDLPITVTLVNFVDDPTGPTPPRNVAIAQYTYDAAGRKVSVTDALGRVHRFTYDRDDRQTSETLVGFRNRDGSTRDVVLSRTSYDAAGNPVLQVTGNGEKAVANLWDAAGRLVSSTLDPGGLNRVTSYKYDANGNVTAKSLSDGNRTETTTYRYDSANRPVAESVDNGGTSLTTTYTHDQRGNATSMVDPRGNLVGANPVRFTTSYGYDAMNQRISQTDPPVLVQTGGTTTTQQRTTQYGFSTFGNQTQTKDRRGNVTTTVFDALDRVTKLRWPTYTRPDGVTLNAVESYKYDAVGHRVQIIDRRGHTTDYVYDRLDRLVLQTDPLVTGETARGTIQYTYNDVGDRLSVTDQRGAVTEYTYDGLDRVRNTTQVVRKASGPPDRFMTTSEYNDLGNQTYSADPVGAITQSTYSSASELLRQTDPLGKVTSFTYDVGSRLVRRTDALGRFSTYRYDLAGRLLTKTDHDSAGAIVATTSYGYDAAGNQISVTSPLGNATTPSFSTTFIYDAGNRLTEVDQPVSAAVSVRTTYQYDAEDNLTSVVNGRGDRFGYTYTSWNQLEDTIEPSTPQQRALADRTFTDIYDRGGLLKTELQPGGVTITRTYDQLDRLRTEVGSGSGVPGARRTFGYDLTGDLRSVNHPTATIAIQRDDRGLVTSVTGGAGASSFTYDANGRMVQRTDAAGTSAFSWTLRGEPVTATDPLTGVTRTYGYDAAGQLTSVKYGSGPAPTRSLGYDPLGRLQTDVLTASSGSALAGYQYAYDANGNVTAEAISLPGNPQAGAHQFTYDFANRVASWTSPLGTVTPYSYDGAGNRTRAGTSAYAFDARNRLVSGPSATYQWSPNGTLRNVTTGGQTASYTFDALGRLANYNGQVAFAYDGLDRIARRGTGGFSYAGTDQQPVTDDTSTYARGPSGTVLATMNGGVPAITGHDRHGDVSYLFAPDGTLSQTTVFDPFGVSISHTGDGTVHAGFQGNFTDPSVGTVDMGARWYAPGADTFLSQDPASGRGRSPPTFNGYTYAVDNPLSFYDPNGYNALAIGPGGLSGSVGDLGAGAQAATPSFSASINQSSQSAQTLTGQSIVGSAVRGNVQAADAARLSALSAVKASAACAMNPVCFYHVPIPQPEVLFGGLSALLAPLTALQEAPARLDSLLLSLPGLGGAYSVGTGLWGYDPILGRELSAREKTERQRQGVDDLIGFVPIVGSVYGIATAAFGYDPIIGRDLTTEERIQRAAFGFIGLKSATSPLVRTELHNAEKAAVASSRPSSMLVDLSRIREISPAAPLRLDLRGVREISPTLRADLSRTRAAAEGAGGVSSGSLDAITNGERIGSGLKVDPFHSAPTWAEPGDIAANGQEFSIAGADGVSRTLVQSAATVNDIPGRFEWIINPDGTVSHQLFVPGGTINGVPIRP